MGGSCAKSNQECVGPRGFTCAPKTVWVWLDGDKTQLPRDVRVGQLLGNLSLPGRRPIVGLKMGDLPLNVNRTLWEEGVREEAELFAVTQPARAKQRSHVAPKSNFWHGFFRPHVSDPNQYIAHFQQRPTLVPFVPPAPNQYRRMPSIEERGQQRGPIQTVTLPLATVGCSHAALRVMDKLGSSCYWLECPDCDSFCRVNLSIDNHKIVQESWPDKTIQFALRWQADITPQALEKCRHPFIKAPFIETPRVAKDSIESTAGSHRCQKCGHDASETIQVINNLKNQFTLDHPELVHSADSRLWRNSNGNIIRRRPRDRLPKQK